MLMDRQHAHSISIWKWSSKLCHKPWFIILLAEPGNCPILILHSSSYRLCNNYLSIISFSEKLQDISSQKKLQSRGSVHPTRACFSSMPATLSVTSHHLDVWSPSFKEEKYQLQLNESKSIVKQNYLIMNHRWMRQCWFLVSRWGLPWVDWQM